MPTPRWSSLSWDRLRPHPRTRGTPHRRWPGQRRRPPRRRSGRAGGAVVAQRPCRRRSVADRPVRSVLAARPLRRSASTPRSAAVDVAVAVAGVPAILAAPSATACFGWVSMATGRPSSPATVSATRGTRDEPPTRSTVCRSDPLDAGAGEAPAERPERLRQGRGDHRLELPTGQADVGEHARQGDGDDDVAVLGEPFLGRHAGLAQADEARPRCPGRSDRARRRPPASSARRGRPRRGRSRCRPGARGRRARRASRSRWRCAAARRRRTCRLRGRRPPRCRPERRPNRRRSRRRRRRARRRGARRAVRSSPPHGAGGRA